MVNFYGPLQNISIRNVSNQIRNTGFVLGHSNYKQAVNPGVRKTSRGSRTAQSVGTLSNKQEIEQKNYSLAHKSSLAFLSVLEEKHQWKKQEL